MPKNERYIYFDNDIILGKPHLTCDEYKDLVFVRRDAKYVKILFLYHRFPHMPFQIVK